MQIEIHAFLLLKEAEKRMDFYVGQEQNFAEAFIRAKRQKTPQTPKQIDVCGVF